MATLTELRNVRLEKLQKLKDLGINPYPAVCSKTHENSKIKENFDNLNGKEVVVAGRITSIRNHSKLAFIDLKDWSGKIQLYIKEENLQNPDHKNSELAFDEIGLLDLGDFAEGSGIVTKTQRGEISVEINELRVLTKSLRPLPDMWDGLKDKEIRLRRRYVDTNINEDVFQRFVRRAKFWQVQREFFNKKGFLEMNIPVLEATPGGADANPFVTHMDAIDQDFYLRISQELYLKRLIGGGYDKVYEIGPRFRNEGISDEHLPEHVAMEFYWAYATFDQGVALITEMFRHIAEEVYHTQKFKMRGFDVDLSKDWERLDYSKIIMDNFGINTLDTDIKAVMGALDKNRIKYPDDISVARGVDLLWKQARKDIGGPAIVVNEPKALSPLAKVNPENDKLTLRLHPIIAGSELGNGFSELNDPIDQFDRFMEQQKLRDSGDAEAQFMDIDFVEMLEYGMPPTFGWGHSERVFWFFEDVPAREGVPFPQLKHEVEDITKKIYGLK